MKITIIWGEKWTVRMKKVKEMSVTEKKIQNKRLYKMLIDSENSEYYLDNIL